MKHDIIFISDLHILLEKTEITRRVLNFLRGRAVAAKALYIIGDLFDAWITSVNFSPDGQTLISGSYDKTVRI